MVEGKWEPGPRFKHDCDGCIFVGKYDMFDGYWCPDKNPDLGGLILLRAGDKEDNYASYDVSTILSSGFSDMPAKKYVGLIVSHMFQQGYLRAQITDQGYRWWKGKPMSDNAHRPMIRLFYADLERCDEGQLRCECPFCDNGILPLSRNPQGGRLLSMDRCTGCGQRVRYLDIDEVEK